MKAVEAVVDQESGQAQIKEGAQERSWPDVCQQFNDDVERVGDIDSVPGYTGLFQCFDDRNQKTLFLVNEDKDLFRMKRKHFLDNIGYKK